MNKLNLTDQSFYRIPILQVLNEIGGNGEIFSVIARVGEIMQDILTDDDKVLVPDGEQKHWEQKLKAEQFSMVKEGLLHTASDSKVGNWSITALGIRFLNGEVNSEILDVSAYR